MYDLNLETIYFFLQVRIIYNHSARNKTKIENRVLLDSQRTPVSSLDAIFMIPSLNLLRFFIVEMSGGTTSEEFERTSSLFVVYSQIQRIGTTLEKIIRIEIFDEEGKSYFTRTLLKKESKK